MKPSLLPVSKLWFFVLLAFNPLTLFTQATIVSSNGYSVHVTLHPVIIIPSSGSCTWGYNYNVKINYVITFSGSNIPAGGLYTLQGSLACNTDGNFFSLPVRGGSGTVTSSSNPWSASSDCATASVVSKGCNRVNLSIAGPGINSQVVSFAVTNQPLPVKLVSFTVEPEQDRVKIKWTTADETDNSYFSVERSIDGKEWKEVIRVNGSGNSVVTRNYERFDETPVDGVSFYRLKQVDIDGQFSISPVKAVTHSAGKKNISVYPVPNYGNTIFINGITDYRDYQLSILTQSGTTLFTASINSFTMNLPQISEGSYILRIYNRRTAQVQNIRYIKLNRL